MTRSRLILDEHHLRADPDLVADWVHGWALARGVAPPVEDHGGLRVEVGLPEQKRRHVFAGVCDGLRQLAETIDEPWVLLKIAGPPDEVPPLLPPRWQVNPETTMMITGLSERAGPPTPAGYVLDIQRRSSATVATFLTPDGELAARGSVGRVGGRAIFDQIRTQATHQRRGLGGAIMHTLEAEAAAWGAEEGVLVATAEGRALYEVLGWRVHALYTTALIPGPAY